jgi:hypothetical protein
MTTKLKRFVVTGYLDEVTVVNLNTPLYNVVGLDWIVADSVLENYAVCIQGYDKGELFDGTKYFACITNPTVNHHLDALSTNDDFPRPLSQIKVMCKSLDKLVDVTHTLFWIELVAFVKEK